MSGDLDHRAAGRLGTTLRGKYRLDRVLGVGGMAVVYVATHRNQKQFAVKMLHPELSLHSEIRQRFLREGYAANSVKHPGAVAVLDDDTAEDGAAFLVMELLEGASVESLWEKQNHRLPAGQVLGMTWQLLDVLAAAHAKGIIHRDIKPANLFLTTEGQLKVLDFGIARVRDIASSSANATGTGTLLGTPAFMAPEQALAKTNEIDARTDIWAVGATMYALFAGRTVHTGETGAEVIVKAATTPALSLGAVVPLAPAPLVAVVDRALAFVMDARWPSAGEMRDAVRDAHVAIEGRPVSRDALVVALHETQPAYAMTEHVVALMSAPTETLEPAPPRPVAPTAQMTQGSPGAIPVVTLRATPPLVGRTTAQPISSTYPGEGAGGASKRGSRGWIVSLVGVAAVGAAAFGVVTMRGAPHEDGAASVASSSTAPAVASVVAAPPVVASATSPAAVVSAPARPDKQEPPGGRNRTNPGQPRPVVPAAAATSASAPAATPSQEPRRPKPGCTPNFDFDAAGHKIFKVDCFGPNGEPL